MTWGQFFVYQGFNDRVGWMHTSSNVDAVDEYLEKVIRVGDKLSYLYGGEAGLLSPGTSRLIQNTGGHFFTDILGDVHPAWPCNPSAMATVALPSS